MRSHANTELVAPKGHTRCCAVYTYHTNMKCSHHAYSSLDTYLLVHLEGKTSGPLVVLLYWDAAESRINIRLEERWLGLDLPFELAQEQDKFVQLLVL